MSYTEFDATTPNPDQTGTSFAQSTLDNLLALRDSAAMGRLPGWDLTSSGGSEPATITHSKGTERLRLSLTWGTSGATAGMVTAVDYDYSADSGSTWTAIGSDAINYDVDGNVASITWS